MSRILNFQVYDRWGSTLFSEADFLPNDPSISWDGKYKGQEVAQGVYIYFAEVEYADGFVEVVSGEIVVLR